jgi:hypothetical protein
MPMKRLVLSRVTVWRASQSTVERCRIRSPQELLPLGGPDGGRDAYPVGEPPPAQEIRRGGIQGFTPELRAAQILRLVVADQLNPARRQPRGHEGEDPGAVRSSIDQIADLNDQGVRIIGERGDRFLKRGKASTDVADQRDSRHGRVLKKRRRTRAVAIGTTIQRS